MKTESAVTWPHRHLLGLEHIDRHEINILLDTAGSFLEVLDRPIKQVPTLRGRMVLHLFYEPSTRTKTSFDMACKFLSAQSVSITPDKSSMRKGETLWDTVETIESMGVDAVVIRHDEAGIPLRLSQRIHACVINAGDGMHEHPTQALLDLFTIRSVKGALEGLNVVITGDIRHSRVARSNIWGLTTCGASVTLVAPPTLWPDRIDQLPVDYTDRLEDALPGADVIYALRLQQERMDTGYIPSLQEYRERYRIDSERLAMAPDDAVLMHPGPVNRGVELSSEVVDSERSLILPMVRNGVAVRMSVLYHLLGGAA